MEWLGWLLLGLFGAVLVGAVATCTGWRVALVIWLIAITATAVVLTAICLIVSGQFPWEAQWN